MFTHLTQFIRTFEINRHRNGYKILKQNLVQRRLRRFFGISKNTGFFEKPVFRFYQSPSIEKPKIPKKDEKL